MKFAHFEMLFLIWSVPVFFLVWAWGWKKRQRILSRYTRQNSRDVITAGASIGKRRLKGLLSIAVLGVVSIAMAGPQFGYKWQEIERRGIDIIVALDCSKSMLATDMKPSRLDRAKREVIDLLNLLKGDRIGLVAFSGTAFLQAPLTLDYNGFHIFLTALNPDYLPVGGSDIAAAISTSLSAFDPKTNSEKAIILITDGENTGRDDPLDAATAAKKEGVKIFCVGVGSEAGVPIPLKAGGFQKDDKGKIVLSKLDEDMLRKTSAITNGAYVRSIAGDMDLDVIYTKEIRGKMEQSTLASGRKQIWEDRYQWFVGLAVIIFIIECIIPSANALPVLVFLVSFSLAHSNPVYGANYRDSMQNGLDTYDKGDYQSALKHFTDAQLEKPDETDIWYNLGNTYYKLGDYDSAEVHYQKALSSKDNSLKEKVYYNLGNTQFRKQLFDEAVKYYEKALKLDPEDIQAKENLEYAKKMRELQKQQQEQQTGKNGEEKGKDTDKADKDHPSDQQREKEDQQKSPSEKSEPEDKKDQPSYGNEMDDTQQAESGQNEADMNDNKENQSPEPQTTPRQIANRPLNEEGKKQAERALNRLHDQPGRAMIPLYQPKHVEKDW